MKTPEEKRQDKILQQEASQINTSLSTLKRVITTMKERGRQIAPFRESRLTRVLQSSLQTGKIAVIINIGGDNLAEARQTLKFSDELSQVTKAR
jgi:23S rRNA pseudoU1915 N3-methylase RlmH